MKKLLILILSLIGISSTAFSQTTGKGSEKSGGFFSRVFHHDQKPRGQMNHFGKRKKDPNAKHNGTFAAKDSKKSKHRVDGDGFGVATQGDKGRRKRKPH